MSDLPAFVPNTQRLACQDCGEISDNLVPRYTGPHIAGYCPECDGRCGSNSHWIKRADIGLAQRSATQYAKDIADQEQERIRQQYDDKGFVDDGGDPF